MAHEFANRSPMRQSAVPVERWCRNTPVSSRVRARRNQTLHLVGGHHVGEELHHVDQRRSVAVCSSSLRAPFASATNRVS